MSSRLRNYLHDTYTTNGYRLLEKVKRNFPIQIDDQDDCDNITEFCNVFVTVGRRNALEIQMSGPFPVTRELADFVDIYQGMVRKAPPRISMKLSPAQIEALNDLASLVRKTGPMGAKNWPKISARTACSLHRFVRVIKEYQKAKATRLH